MEIVVRSPQSTHRQISLLFSKQISVRCTVFASRESRSYLSNVVRQFILHCKTKSTQILRSAEEIEFSASCGREGAKQRGPSVPTCIDDVHFSHICEKLVFHGSHYGGIDSHRHRYGCNSFFMARVPYRQLFQCNIGKPIKVKLVAIYALLMDF